MFVFSIYMLVGTYDVKLYVQNKCDDLKQKLSFLNVAEFVSFCEPETLWDWVWSGLFTQDQMSLSSHHAASKIIFNV